MNEDIKIYRIFNSIIIVENGMRKVITDKEMLKKTNNEILKIYNERR